MATKLGTWRRPSVLRSAGLGLGLLAIGACSSVDYGRAARNPMALPSNAEIANRTQYAGYYRPTSRGAFTTAVAERIDVLKQVPMTEDAAVEIGLLNDSQVQQILNERDYGQTQAMAELADLQAEAGGAPAAEWLLTGILIARTPTSAWDRAFAGEFLGIAEPLVAKAAEIREVYFEAVAASQLAAMFDQVLESERASASLANEQFRSGTISRLGQANRQLAHAESVKSAMQAHQAALAAREALYRELRLFGDQTAWRLPERLPELPGRRPKIDDPEGLAVREGLDALTARADADRFEHGTRIRSEAREAYAAMLHAYDLAKYQRDVVLPLSQMKLDETQLHYNAMLEDVYELVEATRQQIEAGKDYVEALAGFWQARAAFIRLIGGRERPSRALIETAQPAGPAA